MTLDDLERVLVMTIESNRAALALLSPADRAGSRSWNGGHLDCNTRFETSPAPAPVDAWTSASMYMALLSTLAFCAGAALVFTIWS